MNSVRHTWRQQISTNKNEEREKENISMQEPNRKLLDKCREDEQAKDADWPGPKC